jgi:hypothetical protein
VAELDSTTLEVEVEVGRSCQREHAEMNRSWWSSIVVEEEQQQEVKAAGSACVGACSNPCASHGGGLAVVPGGRCP